MISVHLDGVTRADPDQSEGMFWVTLRFGEESRLVIMTRTFDHAVTIADAINAGSPEEPVAGALRRRADTLGFQTIQGGRP